MFSKIYERYLAQQIYWVFFFILFAFVGLFFFFDLLSEVGSVRGQYTFLIVALRILLQTPNHFYEIIPIATLIGAIYVFAQLASSSEFTIFRVAGLDTRRALFTLFKIGVPLMLATYMVGELIGPWAEQMSEKVRLQALGSTVSSNFRSGVWVKDSLNVGKSDKPEAAITRFINVGKLMPDQSIAQVKIYEFDSAFRLQAIRLAEQGHYNDAGFWDLKQVQETRFKEDRPKAVAGQEGSLDPVYTTQQINLPTLHMPTELTPQILTVLLVQPESMSMTNLFTYVQHLHENKQDAHRYEIAFWKKLVYPLTVFVMLALALPFAYLHARAGAVGVKVFGGIMLGMSFVLVNNLFSHVGLLNAWPAYLTAFVPGMLYLGLAIIALYWVQNR